MNGETDLLTRIVLYTRTFQRDHVMVKFAMSPYERSITFNFADGTKAGSSEDWLARISGKISRIIYHPSPNLNNPEHIGFSNAERQFIVTIYNDDTVSYWFSRWEFNRLFKKWVITFTERVWENPPVEMSGFRNNIEDFKNVLYDIGILAKDLGFPDYARVFDRAYRLLTGEMTITDVRGRVKTGFDYSLLSGDAERMYWAADIADVFGGLGSWNDSPSCVADDTGRGEEFKNLSFELYVQSRNAIAYAVNHDDSKIH